MDGGYVTMNRYPAIVDVCKGAYGVVIPDIPGACCAMGSTVDEALLNAEDALVDFVSMLEEDGNDIPSPSSIDDISLEDGGDGGLRNAGNTGHNLNLSSTRGN